MSDASPVQNNEDSSIESNQNKSYRLVSLKIFYEDDEGNNTLQQKPIIEAETRRSRNEIEDEKFEKEDPIKGGLNIITINKEEIKGEQVVKRSPQIQPMGKSENISVYAVITMYNESFTDLKETLDSICTNFKDLRKVDENIKIKILVIVDGLEQFLKKLNQDEKEKTNFEEKFCDINQMKEVNLGKDFNIQSFDETFTCINELIKIVNKKLNKINQRENINSQDSSERPNDDTNNKLQKHNTKIENSTESLRDENSGEIQKRDAEIENIDSNEKHRNEIIIFEIKEDVEQKNTEKDHNYEFGHLFERKYKLDNSEFDLQFLIKHENKRKLNSHLWFFSGFCRVNEPKYCLFIDVGTNAEDNAFGYLYNKLEKGSTSTPKVAGVCGEIKPNMSKAIFTNVLIHAQKVEYKFSHILDKSLESMLGFIPVLPGAFSAYNYQCLEPENLEGPLWGDYFKSLRFPKKMNCFSANMYLAEDRILSFSLIKSKNYANILKYVVEAKAVTDVPETMISLLNQRRRWINGTWFATLLYFRSCCDIYNSKQNFCRKIVLLLQIAYYFLNVLYSLFLVGGSYLAFSICVRQQLRSGTIPGNRSVAGNLLILFYLMQLMLLVIISLGTKLKYIEQTFYLVSTILCFYMSIFIFLVIGIMTESFNDPLMISSLTFTAGVFIVVLLINKCLFETALSIIQFLIATPIYINVFNIYAICNIHDVSWGNRADNANDELEKEKKDEFKKYRTGWVLIWTYSNGFLAYLLDSLDASDTQYGLFAYFIGFIGLIVLVFRFLGAISYLLCYYCSKDCFVKIICCSKRNESGNQHINRDSSSNEDQALISK